MITLTPGANANIPQGVVSATISYSPIPGADIDISAFLLYGDGKVRGDTDMCFYGQPTIKKSAVQILAAENGRSVFSFNLAAIDADVERIAISATIHENKASFAACSRLVLSLTGDIEAVVPTQGMKETALILGEFYRRNGQWKFRFVSQGFVGGLDPLAKHFGVNIISAEAPVPKAVPVAPPTPVAAPINLSKISLDKNKRSIDLEKKDGNFGEIIVNLNWNKGSSGGFLGMGKSDPVDLDLGCLYQLKDGTIGCVQALGRSFGSFRDEPYVQLMGDDRTGSNADGETLRINGSHWREIKRLLLFTFIYEGVASWHSTDGVVTIKVPGQPDIEIKMSEEGGQLSMCALALLENVSGAVRVSREVRFFRHHGYMDNAYGWGLNWSPGSK